MLTIEKFIFALLISTIFIIPFIVSFALAVFLRKTQLINSLHHMNSSKGLLDESTSKWEYIRTDLNNRYDALRILNTKPLEIINEKIILIDLMVEKAQARLTERAESYYYAGAYLYLFTFTIIIYFSIFSYFSDDIVILVKSALLPDEKSRALMESQNEYIQSDILRFLLLISKRLLAGGAVLGVCYMLAATANSCFRESTILLHRRHSLRYVRLMSYQNNGTIPEEALKDVFGIGDVMNTGFDRIKPHTLKDNLIGKLIDAIGKIGSRLPGEKDKKG